MSSDNQKSQLNNLEKYQAMLPYLLAAAECFVSRKSCKAVRYAISEPSGLVLSIINVPEYPSIEEMKFFAHAPLAVRQNALRKAARDVPNAANTQSLFKDIIKISATFGHAGWTLRRAEKELIKLLEARYDELVTRTNNRFWRNMYEKGAIIEGDEIGREITSYLYDIIVGLGEFDLKTRSEALRDILGLDSRDVTVIVRRIMNLLEKPDSAETQHAATIMILSYLDKKYGVNKGRSKSAIGKVLGEGTYYKGQQIENEQGEIEEQVIDPHSQDDFLAVDRLLLYRDIMQTITDQKDKDAFELAFKHSMGELTDTQYEAEAIKRGLTPDKIDDRLRYMPKKYPQLASLN